MGDQNCKIKNSKTKIAVLPKLKIEKLHLSLKFVYLGYFDKLK
jgi:hypothetical protein